MIKDNFRNPKKQSSKTSLKNKQKYLLHRDKKSTESKIKSQLSNESMTSKYSLFINKPQSSIKLQRHVFSNSLSKEWTKWRQNNPLPEKVVDVLKKYPKPPERRDYSQVDEQDPFLPPTAASQAIAARALHSQGGGLGGGSISDRGGASQYATLNRKFRTLDHPSASRRAEVTNYGMGGRRNEPGNSYTLGSRSKSRMDGPGQYNTLSKKCKTLESSDFY